MRILTAEVAGLPVGTKWDVIETAERGTVVRWIGCASDRGDRQPRSGRVYDGTTTAAGPLFAAHLATLGVNETDEAPCAACGSLILAVLTVCPECKADPDGQVGCMECDIEPDGSASGFISYDRGGEGHIATCPNCRGDKVLDGPYAEAREDALAKARAWKKAQSPELNPVPAGIGQ